MPHSAGIDDLFITQVIVSDPTWPNDLTLDLNKSNWQKWGHQIELIADKFGIGDYLAGTLARPNPSKNPKAHCLWSITDHPLHMFIVQHIWPLEFEVIRHLSCSLPTTL
jgi:hypothetical protein